MRRAWTTAVMLLVCVIVGAIIALTPSRADAQTAATLSGWVIDQSGAVLPGVVVTATQVDTGFKRETASGSDGHFTLSSLPPGKYVVDGKLTGFQTAEVRDVILSINDQRSVRLEMGVAGIGETVHVQADVTRIGTSPAVSTVVDRQFVENLPLNGRSLQSLLELTPGVSLFKANSNPFEGGQFSVNGQRTDANYFMVDGVSANASMTVGSGNFAGQSASGVLPALTALGTTQSLVSIDALEEFRVQTSTYSAEFGRTPGAQISMLTRSGGNTFHGSVSEYFRHDAMDAKDWFANALGLPKAKLRQNDFGGTLGGPIFRNHTFFFGSYEGLRLSLPHSLSTSVPSLAIRQSASAPMRDLLNLFPLPTGPENGTTGLAQYSVSYSDPSQFDTTAVRLDHVLNDRFLLFGRYSHAPSMSSTRAGGLSTSNVMSFKNDALTGGANWILTGNTTNDLRMNWTDVRALLNKQADTLGGAVVAPIGVLVPAPYTLETASTQLSITNSGSVSEGPAGDNQQTQFNLVDTFTRVTGSHALKFGVDYRRMMPVIAGTSGSTFANYRINLPTDVTLSRMGTVQLSAIDGNHHVAYNSLSLFAQDSWTIGSRLSLMGGIRWELNPAPHATDGHDPLVLANIYADPVTLAPRGEDLYKTTYTNFAPRVGASYQLAQGSGHELVVRGGFGIFYDTGFGESSVTFDAMYPWFATVVTSNVPYPFQPPLVLPVPGTTAPTQFYQVDGRLKLPYTEQWNASIEQRLGGAQTLTMSYLGSAGRRLLRFNKQRPFFTDFGARFSLTTTTNSAVSDYRALQVQFQRRLSRGLQALVNYTWAQSTDTVSDDGGFLSNTVPDGVARLDQEYGPSDFDVRHELTAGVTYEIPTPFHGRISEAIFGNWGVDGMLRARSAFPLNVLATVPYPETGTTYAVRPDIVAGVPEVLTGSQYPGGKAINVNAFVATAAGAAGGNFPRNSLRGFPAQQVDLTLRRQFRLRQNLRLQLRLESFNVFNHPNFADPSTTLSDASFGVSNQVLSRGLLGLNSLYQMGGPRSTQLSVKLQF